jgi:flagellar basal body rod protein FlgB
VERFNRDLRQFIAARKRGGGAARSVQDIDLAIDHPPAGILFHDRNNRSMEHLQSDLAKNALMHNMAIELLRKQYQTIEMAIKERVT